MLSRMIDQFFLWFSWLILPIFMEIIRNIFILIFAFTKLSKKKDYTLEYYPNVTILVPIYNSSKTLKMCLESITNQNYPINNLEVFLMNNGKRDESYDIFQQFQSDNLKLKVWWLDSDSGKSKALNKGIFLSSGKYIINIDSDGWLDENAIRNVIHRFENDRNISCMTGVVLIDPNLIEETNNKKLKLLQLCEFFEYVESFLIGRNFQSFNDTLYTLAGAFSCFRKEALLKTQLYNSDTLGEDTHMTFQVRKFIGGKILLCDDAYLFVDPIEGIDKLYMQRQRWQRSELEVARLFSEYHEGGIIDLFNKSTMRLIISDHTVAFLNLIWSFSLIYFLFIEYPMKYFVFSQILLFFIYTLNSLLYDCIAEMFLKNQDLARNYLRKKRYVAAFMVPYRLLNYFIRLAGVINSIGTESKWYTKSLSQEIKELKEILNLKKVFKSYKHKN